MSASSSTARCSRPSTSRTSSSSSRRSRKRSRSAIAHEMVCAFINIDMEAVGNWAERHNLPYTGYTDLASKPEVLELMRESVEKVNADLGGRSEARQRADPPLHRSAQGTRCRRRRTDAHAQSAAALHPGKYGRHSSMRCTAARNEQYIETWSSSRTGAPARSRATLKVRDAKTFAADAEGGLSDERAKLWAAIACLRDGRAGRRVWGWPTACC